MKNCTMNTITLSFRIRVIMGLSLDYDNMVEKLHNQADDEVLRIKSIAIGLSLEKLDKPRTKRARNPKISSKKLECAYCQSDKANIWRKGHWF